MQLSRHNGYQWRIIVGLTLLVLSYILRVSIVRFSLKLVHRAFPQLAVWIKEFERNLERPLSWLVFVLLAWLCAYLMDLSSLLGIESSTIVSIVTLALSVPLIWTAICLCNYITWVCQLVYWFTSVLIYLQCLGNYPCERVESISFIE